MGSSLDTLLTQAAFGFDSWKRACRAAATSNVTLSGEQTIDGVALVAGERALLMVQDNAAQNGPWLVGAGAWTRPPEFDTSADVAIGSTWFVVDGAANSGWWALTSPTTGIITLGSTALTISKVVGENLEGRIASLQAAVAALESGEVAWPVLASNATLSYGGQLVTGGTAFTLPALSAAAGKAKAVMVLFESAVDVTVTAAGSNKIVDNSLAEVAAVTVPAGTRSVSWVDIGGGKWAVTIGLVAA